LKKSGGRTQKQLSEFVFGTAFQKRQTIGVVMSTLKKNKQLRWRSSKNIPEYFV